MVVLTVGGAIKVLTPDEDGKIRVLYGGRKEDIFGENMMFHRNAIRLPALAKNNVKKPG